MRISKLNIITVCWLGCTVGHSWSLRDIEIEIGAGRNGGSAVEGDIDVYLLSYICGVFEVARNVIMHDKPVSSKPIEHEEFAWKRSSRRRTKTSWG